MLSNVFMLGDGNLFVELTRPPTGSYSATSYKLRIASAGEKWIDVYILRHELEALVDYLKPAIP